MRRLLFASSNLLAVLASLMLLPGVAGAQPLPIGPPIAKVDTPTVQFGDNATGQYQTYWSSGTITLTITLADGAPGETYTVQWTTQDGTASSSSSPADYVAAANTAVFVAGVDGSASQQISITINNNGQSVSKTFSVVLSNPLGGGASLGSPWTAVITVLPPPPPPTAPANIRQKRAKITPRLRAS